MSPQTRDLGALLASADCAPRCAPPGWETLRVTGLTMDSRRARPGELFLAAPGLRLDGRQFIADAVARGAAAVCVDGAVTAADVSAAGRAPVLGIDDLARRAGPIASAWHHHPSQALRVLGVTGTNGKTSATHHLAEMLGALGERAGLCGTLGNGFPGRLRETGLTTADPVTLQYSLATLRDAGAAWVAMEVSSHALDQERVNGIRFEGALLTNLSRDHLDYHGSMDAYGEAKRQLFLAPGLEVAVVNRDDAFARSLPERMPTPVRVHDYSLQDPAASLRATRIDPGTTGVRARIESVWGEGELRTRLLGGFALSNLLGAVTLLAGLGVALRDLLEAAAEVVPVPGRMQAFAHPHGFTIVVDYAHTPDALEQALRVLRSHFDRGLICVFGCGGERDAGKRPEMAAVAAQFADRVLITDDNPRGEDGDHIVAQIAAGMPAGSEYRIERDRRAAIALACASARPGDVVLVAGKGHEDYQDGADGRVHYSDLETVGALLADSEAASGEALANRNAQGRDAAGA